MRGLWSRFVWLVSGEWMLAEAPNGGDIILARSLFVSVLLYLAFIGLKQVLDPNRSWSFSAVALQQEARDSLSVFGALLAAAYVSLYARFAAQWNYLAGLYNKIIETEVHWNGDETAKQHKEFASWKASFIEDADELHLSTKRIFVPAIRTWLIEPDVRAAFIADALGGEKRLAALEDRLARVS